MSYNRLTALIGQVEKEAGNSASKTSPPCDCGYTNGTVIISQASYNASAAEAWVRSPRICTEVAVGGCCSKERNVIENRWCRMSGIDLGRRSTLRDKTGWQMTPFECSV